MMEIIKQVVVVVVTFRWSATSPSFVGDRHDPDMHQINCALGELRRSELYLRQAYSADEEQLAVGVQF